MNNIYDALEAIKVKPELYLGAKNLTYLYHFINGYLFNVDDDKDPMSEKIRGLHFWVPEKTGVEVDNLSENILTKTAGNQEEALYLFFDYLEMFKEEVLKID